MWTVDSPKIYGADVCITFASSENFNLKLHKNILYVFICKGVKLTTTPVLSRVMFRGKNTVLSGGLIKYRLVLVQLSKIHSLVHLGTYKGKFRYHVRNLIR
jgi:hypothetical protein